MRQLAVVWGVAVLWLLDRIRLAVEREGEEHTHIAGFTPLPSDEEDEEEDE